MYHCQLCHKVVPPGTPCQRIVTETRPKKYHFRPNANRVIRISESGKRKEVYVDDPGGAGHEIAQELILCPSCERQNGQA